MTRQHEVFVNGKNISPELSTENVDISAATQHDERVVLAPKVASMAFTQGWVLMPRLLGRMRQLEVLSGKSTCQQKQK